MHHWQTDTRKHPPLTLSKNASIVVIIWSILRLNMEVCSNLTFTAQQSLSCSLFEVCVSSASCLTFTCVPTFILHCHADFQRHCSKVHSVKLPTSLPAGLFTQVHAAYLYSPDVATNRRETQRTVVLTSCPSFLRRFNCFSFLVKLSLLIKDISSRLELVRSPQRVFLVALPPPVKPAVQKSLQENLSQRMNSLYLSV